jgi:hypothetical protein
VGCLQLLLDAGADVNAQNDCKRLTALHVAALAGHHDAVQLLLERGADANAVNAVTLVGVQVNGSTDKFTALHIAALFGHAEVVEVLISAGASVAASDDGLGFTPLHMAALHGHAAVVQQLLAAGADVNARSIDNLHPLWLAAVKGHLEVVKLLVCGGADSEENMVKAARRAAGKSHTAIWAFLTHKVHILYPEAIGDCLAVMGAVTAPRALLTGWKSEVDRHEEILEAARRERAEGDAARQQAQQLIIQSALMLKQVERRRRDMRRNGKKKRERDSWWSQSWRGLCLGSLAACVAGSTCLWWNSSSRTKGKLQLKTHCFAGS